MYYLAFIIRKVAPLIEGFIRIEAKSKRQARKKILEIFNFKYKIIFIKKDK